ncbi:MAG: hypothetical protein MSH25_06385 [Desulfovibrio sp.]|uniref:hypothetical protein n=1 Tax=Desulfovibrio sp. TaxID=885 RepID=UPI0025BDAA8D|nr:hypothetical protein [Desulfovibrio sp.]MCI7568988.1 hypothetical protein [Desulfovibrio sp.]
MAYVQIDPVACAEVAELFLSEVTFALLVNEWGRNVRRDEKIRDAVYAILNTLLASGAPVYLARRVHGRTFFVVLAENERSRISPRMFQETMTGHDDSEWICFDRNELFQAMPQLREEYPEPRISGDPWFRVMKHLDNLDFKKIFPEVVRPSGDNSESVMLGKDQYEDMAFAWESDEHTNKRIAELETALAAKDAELEQARAEMSALREEVAALKTELKQAQEKIPYTLWLEVCAMRGEGKTDNEIAATLYDKGQGLSKSQLGALLYAGNETRPASTTLQDWGTRLFR